MGIVLGALLVGGGLLVALMWGLTFHPPTLQAEPIVCPPEAPTLAAGQPLRVMTFNVQYMAGKRYIFWYDLPDKSGPDERPTPADITHTLAEVARVIGAEQPDVVLLQEVDDGAARTDGEDQLARLLALLPAEYGCHAAAFYWKAGYVPHPRIHGAVGLKMVTLSRYRMVEATRHQLPLIPAAPLTRHFGLKRAILETRLPVAGGKPLVVLNTHFDAFAQGYDTMRRQVGEAKALMDALTAQGVPWLFGGDLNLLPPGHYERLRVGERLYYEPTSELAVLYDAYAAVPSLSDASGPEAGRWFTYFGNGTEGGPDRTLDYLFYSDTLRLLSSHVRQADTLAISDHLPVVAEFLLP